MAGDRQEATDRETLTRDLMEDQYGHPVRIVTFNTVGGWSREVTMDIADELRRRFAEYDEMSASVREFLDRWRVDPKPASVNRPAQHRKPAADAPATASFL